MDKVLEAFLPKILTERVLLGIAFLILLTEDYILLVHRASLSWLDQALPKLGVKDVLYFLMALAFSWLFVLPSIRALAVIIYALNRKGRLRPLHPFKRVTGAALLSQAVNTQNAVAYQHFESYIKHVKEQQLVRDLYFYILVLSSVNICFSGSLIQHVCAWQAFGWLPIGIFPLFMLVYLGIALGVVGAVDNDDDTTDVRGEAN